MKDALIRLVSAHKPIDSLESEHTRNTLEFLNRHEDCVSTANRSGHVTASSWILSPDRTKTLLTHHKKLNRWLQLGGHIEDDSTIHDAALREAKEESGNIYINLISETIFDIDVHLIPARKNIPSHYHYDIRFLCQADSTHLQISDESNKLAWVALTDVPELLSDESVLRMCRKCEAYL